MNSTLTSFVDELRAVGIPVSMVETLDAADALEHVDLSESENLRAALGATLVKNPHHYPAFDAAFDVYFGGAPALLGERDPGTDSQTSDADLRDSIVEALMNDDRETLRQLVGRAVDRAAGDGNAGGIGSRSFAIRRLRRARR